MVPRPDSSDPHDSSSDLRLAELARLRAEDGATCELSLVAPAFNEEESLPPLQRRVVEALGERFDWELVLVDDGSTDATAEVIQRLSREDPRVRGVFFRANRGQTAAMAAGIHLARGRLIATLDADMQNDPIDLPGMLERLEHHDAVVGFRIKRNDSLIRRISSRTANWVRNRLSGDDIRDTGCSLKIFRSEAVRTLPLFEGMHRFLPTLLRYHGYSVIEHGVSHHPRTKGKSKYGIRNRLFRSLRDLFAVRWMRSRLIRIPLEDASRSPLMELPSMPAARSAGPGHPHHDASAAGHSRSVASEGEHSTP